MMFANKAADRRSIGVSGLRISWQVGILVACLLIFLLLGAHQLALPGLQYDEAKEAGLNAMQLVTGQPVTAFRDAVLQVGPWSIPLMVQDYIGSLNVLLATPFLAIGGVNVVALRWLPLLIGALTLWLTWRVALRLGGPLAASVTALLLALDPTYIFWNRQGIFVTNITALCFMASLVCGLRWWQLRRRRDLWLMTLFWGLGLYAKLLFVWAIGGMVGVAAIAWLWQRFRQRRAGPPLGAGATPGEPAESVGTAVGTPNVSSACPPPGQTFRGDWQPVILSGSATNSPMRRASSEESPFGTPRPSAEDALPRVARGQLAQGDTEPVSTIGIPGAAGPGWRPTLVTWGVAAVCFLLPLIPLILFNLRTSGTLLSVLGNLGRSYYGVDNRAYWPNLVTRINQLRILLRGDHLWYLGEVYSNDWAPWLAAGLVAAALGMAVFSRGRRARVVFLPLGLLALMVAQSAFTVSDLFITHDAMLLPLLPLAGGLAAGALLEFRPARGHSPLGLVLPTLAGLALLGWAGTNAVNTIQYHNILTQSGGYGSHSDGVYRLAAFLEQEAPSAPLALDWGLDAQLRFLSSGRVNPVEVFGYTSLDQPDPGFAGRIEPFLANPSSLYVAHVPDETVFRGRVDVLKALAAQHGLELREEARFGLRSGRILFVVYRAAKAGS